MHPGTFLEKLLFTNMGKGRGRDEKRKGKGMERKLRRREGGLKRKRDFYSYGPLSIESSAYYYLQVIDHN